MNQAIALLGLIAMADCQDPVPTPLPATKLPVREVTVFKDGHAYIVREAALPADANGKVVLDELPQPLLGTFWPYASDGARLIAAKAGRDKVRSEVAAVDLRQIARANVGKEVVVVTVDKERIEGKLAATPARGEGSAATDAELLVLTTGNGTRALPMSQVRDLEVRGAFVGTVQHEEHKERLELRVDGGGKDARIGVMYVQKGLRWVPAYRLDLDGKGQAAVAFEATLVNDLIDLERATVHFVVGVPKFAFEGLVDPISLQQEMAAVAEAADISRRFDHRNVLANSLMTQSAAGQGAGDDPAPTVGEGATTEDLFVFTVKDVTLKKGERLVLPIRSFAMAYKDVYKLDIPFAPPVEVRQHWQSQQLVELARQMAAPKAIHVLRLQNGGDAPLTTAPALVLAGGRVLAQGRMTYTSRGREVDLEINPAIDIRVESTDREAGRDQGPIRRGGNDYSRIDIASTIALWNGKAEPVQLEVTRRALGIGSAVGQDGKQQQLGLLQAWQQGEQPAWWGWWSWPYWWFEQNGFAEFRWNLTLAPGQTQKLDASWHYFWR